MEIKSKLSSVHAFWNTEACGTHFVEQHDDERDFYEKFREHRYRTEWHLPLLVPFTEVRGWQLLEIGIGNGADAAMFALNGAHYTGVDLTEAALDATRKHFDVLGLQGTFKKGNAEQLSFERDQFDMIYSHGVLHHTPNTQAAFDEVYRVLKPGGRVVIMLYHKHSFNYYVRIMAYMRLRVLLKVLSRVGRWESDRLSLRAEEMQGVRGNQDRKVWQIHYENFLRTGWRYLKAANFVHHCTDGPECPVAFAFSRQEVRRIFHRFTGVEMKVAHFPLKKYPLGRFIPFGIEKFLASRMGWYLFVYASKQADPRV